MIKKGRRKHHERIVERVIERNKNVKCLKPSLGGVEIFKIQGSTGEKINDKENMIVHTYMIQRQKHQKKYNEMGSEL